MATANFNASTYTVAWIAALQIERAAALAHLDERHVEPRDFEQNRMDSNSYQWGRSGKHNVVVASLPSGRVGTTPAAVATSNLLASLPWIRFGLLVGIGGGIPRLPDRDIRLGDVVVSQPTKTTGGVIQYDKGAALADGKWQRRSVLNSPPGVLLSALGAIQAEHELSQPELPKFLEAMETRYARMVQSGYTYQGQEHDQLYKSSYNHIQGKSGTCNLCDQSLTVDRPQRLDNEPKIHYGLVASGNTIFKGALAREEIELLSASDGARDGDEECLCVEMEAAGIMNDFPCLVIRGISDYADSHKNDKWQRYAAATAAAYAKELLGYVQAWKLETTQQAVNAVGSIELQIQNVQETLDNLCTASLDAELRKAIDRLPVVDGASYDSQAEGDSPRCLPGTRVELFKHVRQWIEDPAAQSVFWLNGQAGTGKSTITRSLGDILSQEEFLTASFFFKRGEGERGSLSKFFTTIAWQLARRRQSVAVHIKDALECEPNLMDAGMTSQFDKLILEPFEKGAKSEPTLRETRPVVLLVDALDECHSDGGSDLEDKVRLLIRLLLRATRCGLKIFITSRPELPIRLELLSHPGTYHGLVLHELPRVVIKKDISTFLHHEIRSIKVEWNNAVADTEDALPQDWPSEADFKKLLIMAVPLFIFASTICRFMRDFRFGSPQEQLKEIIELGTKTPELGLDATYRPILNRVVAGLRPARRNQILGKFRNIIGAVVSLGSPLSIHALGDLLEISSSEIRRHLDNYHSVLGIPSNSKMPVHLLHLSFRDFLVSSERRDEEFWIDEHEAHYQLVLHCVRIMEIHLARDICNLQWPGTKLSTIEPRRIDRFIPPELRYACIYWTYHMQQSHRQISEDLIYSFLSRHFLHWIEALVITGGRVLETVQQLHDQFPPLLGQPKSSLREFIADSRLWVKNYVQPIQSTPLQIYSSALLFTSPKSPVRSAFDHEIPSWISIAPRVKDVWDTQLLQHFHVENSSHYESLAFSHDGQFFAASSIEYGKTACIQIWNVQSGQLLNRLCSADGQSLPHIIMAFTHDLGRLAAARFDGKVEMWDLETGQCLWIAQQSSPAYSASALATLRFSQDSKSITLTVPFSGAYLSRNWSVPTGECDKTSYGSNVHIDWHEAFAFASSSNFVALAYSRAENEIESSYNLCADLHIWDIHTGSLIRTTTLIAARRPGAFSPDLCLFASACTEGTIGIWQVDTPERLYHFDSGALCKSMAFSQDGQSLITACDPGRVQVWTLSSGEPSASFCIAPRDNSMYKHTALMAFSPDLLMVASARTTDVRIWCTTINEHAAQPQPITPNNKTVQFFESSISSDSNLVSVVLEGSAGVEVWRTDTSDLTHITFGAPVGTRQANGICPISPNSRYLADTLMDSLVLVRRIDGGLDNHILCRLAGSLPVRFSPDSLMIAINAPDAGVLVVQLEMPAVSQLLQLPNATVGAIVFSKDSALIAAASLSTVFIFSTASGDLVSTIDSGLSTSRKRPIVSVDFSNNSSMLAAITNEPACGVYNVQTGECLDQRKVKHHRQHLKQLGETVKFCSDGRLLTRYAAFKYDPVHNLLDDVPFPQLGLKRDRDWITWDGHDLLWVPMNYRNRIGATSAEVLLFLSLMGDLEIIKLDPNRIPDADVCLTEEPSL